MPPAAGTYHDTKQDAVATVLTIMARGFPYIDVGCFQVDLAYHAGVFRSLDEAFDPDHNAQAAARILLTERANAADWATAVARYHSATPELGGPYLERVRRALPTARLRALAARDDPAPDQALTQIKMPTAPTNLPLVIYARAPNGRRVEPQVIKLGAPQSQPVPATAPQLRTMQR